MKAASGTSGALERAGVEQAEALPAISRSEKALLAAAFALFALLLLARWAGSTVAYMTHGPVVGAVTPQSAVVFLRTNVPAGVSVILSADPRLQTATSSAPVATALDKDLTTQISLSGLAPSTTYYMNISVDGRSQFHGQLPSFKTFPAAGQAWDFTVGILTDFVTPNPHVPYRATFRSMDQEKPDFVLLGGDFDHSDPTGATADQALAAKRFMFKRLYSYGISMQKDFVDLILRRYAVAHMWDDHDYGGNNSDKTYPFKQVSLQVLKEYFPLYPVGSNGDWQSFRYAQAEFFLLDSRSQRDPNAKHDGATKSLLDGDRLGAYGQLEWLKNGLLQSTARWKFIVSPSVWNPTVEKNDSWTDYAYERNLLVNFIKSNNITGVIFQTGDVHIGAIDDGSHSTFPELLAPAANLNWGVCSTSPVDGQWSQGIYDTGNRDCPGYGLIRVLTNPDRVELYVKDQTGKTLITYTAH